MQVGVVGVLPQYYIVPEISMFEASTDPIEVFGLLVELGAFLQVGLLTRIIAPISQRLQMRIGRVQVTVGGKYRVVSQQMAPSILWVFLSR